MSCSTQVARTQIFQITVPSLGPDFTGRSINLPMHSKLGELVRKEISQSMNIFTVVNDQGRHPGETARVTYHYWTHNSEMSVFRDFNSTDKSAKVHRLQKRRSDDLGR